MPIAMKPANTGPKIDKSHPMWWADIQFDLLDILGEGSQGRVYKALRRDRRTGLSQVVALKILHSRTAVDLWRHEFESLARVRSPYCVQVLSFERYKRRPALVLEFIDGVSLTELGRGCLLSPDETGEVLAQLEMALKDLHSHGVFHGDLSPHNILIDGRGRVRVLDFGLANSSEGNLRVTAEFAAPERLNGAHADLASDIFSLGRIEQFLRGDDLNSEVDSAASPYLRYSPAARSLRDLVPRADTQKKLGGTVTNLISRRKMVSAIRTQSQLLVSKVKLSYKDFLLGLIASLMVLATSSATLSRPKSQWGSLDIRTKQWHRISIDGRDLGYSPVSVSLAAGKSYKLQWASNHGRGEKKITVQPQERRLLEDSDFSH